MSSRVLVKPKNEGMSFLMPEGHKTFDGVGDNGEEIVVIAKDENEADDLAKKHYCNVNFSL